MYSNRVVTLPLTRIGTASSRRSIAFLGLLVTTVATTRYPVVVNAFHAFPATLLQPSSSSSTRTSSVRTFPSCTMCFSSKNTQENEENHNSQKQQQEQQQQSQQKETDFQVKTFNPLRLAVLRLGFTEPAWTSPLNYGEKVGSFTCAYCGQELFDSSGKYDSGSGWPSWWRSSKEGAIAYKMEFDGRLECQCGRCKSHLGHVFPDGPKQRDVAMELLQTCPPSDPRSKQQKEAQQQDPNSRLPRFCVNGASIKFEERQDE